VATVRALREASTPPTGPVYLSISADLLNREGLEAEVGEGAGYRIEPPAPARPQTIEAIAKRLAEAKCPALMFGDDVWREGALADVRGTLAALCEALKKRPGAEGWARQRAKVRAFAKTLIEREEKLVRDHADDAIIHPAVLEAQLAEALPRNAVMVQESSTAR